MQILIVSRTFPAPDRNSGDLRFSRLLGLLSARLQIYFCATAAAWQRSEVGEAAGDRYRQQIVEMGIEVIEGPVPRVLRAHVFDAVIFEFYDVAEKYVGFVRSIQPRCKVVIDTVDIHYERMRRGAELTRDPRDFAMAAEVRESEIASYAAADLLIAVTRPEMKQLAALQLGVAIAVVPNINTIHPPGLKNASLAKQMLFVGGFTHAPNEDAITFFCAEVLPKVLEACPDAKLTIVGNAPTARVRQLASSRVTVVGYVPDIDPFLQTHGISIAPLRFGAGLKGKVGEALGAELAVVTTTIGAEGMGLTPGVHAAVSDTAEGIAKEIVALMVDPARFEAMRMAGRLFFAEHFGAEAVGKAVDELIDVLTRIQPKSLPLLLRMRNRMLLWRASMRGVVDRHVRWRFE